MELIELILIVAGVITAIIAFTVAIAKVTAYFKNKFGFSIWSGVLFTEFAVILAGLDVTHYGGTSILLGIISLGLLLLTFVQDIRLAKTMGLLAFLIQIVMSLIFILIVALAVIGYILKLISKRNNALLDLATGTTKEFRDGIFGVASFLRF